MKTLLTNFAMFTALVALQACRQNSLECPVNQVMENGECRCLDGFKGENCKEVDKCALLDCQDFPCNDGVCQCGDWYFGEYCEFDSTDIIGRYEITDFEANLGEPFHVEFFDLSYRTDTDAQRFVGQPQFINGVSPHSGATAQARFELPNSVELYFGYSLKNCCSNYYRFRGNGSFWGDSLRVEGSLRVDMTHPYAAPMRGGSKTKTSDVYSAKLTARKVH